jgi:hemolysin-activating ACP:hemolysin acyltransferase
VNWAWLSAEAADRYAATRHPVGADEWRSGPNLWCCEIVTRPGAMPDLLSDLRSHVFPPGTRLRWLRIGLSGELLGIGDFRIP